MRGEGSNLEHVVATTNLTIQHTSSTSPDGNPWNEDSLRAKSESDDQSFVIDDIVFSPPLSSATVLVPLLQRPVLSFPGPKPLALPEI